MIHGILWAGFIRFHGSFVSRLGALHHALSAVSAAHQLRHLRHLRRSGPGGPGSPGGCCRRCRRCNEAKQLCYVLRKHDAPARSARLSQVIQIQPLIYSFVVSLSFTTFKYLCLTSFILKSTNYKFTTYSLKVKP